MKDDTHTRMDTADKIALLGEVEHERRHLVRSMHSTEDPERRFKYKVRAAQAKRLRRKLQHRWLGTEEVDWCSVKACSRIKQLNEEILEDDDELFSEIEDWADGILSEALGEDLSGCSACRGDEDSV